MEQRKLSAKATAVRHKEAIGRLRRRRDQSMEQGKRNGEVNLEEMHHGIVGNMGAGPIWPALDVRTMGQTGSLDLTGRTQRGFSSGSHVGIRYEHHRPLRNAVHHYRCQRVSL